MSRNFCLCYECPSSEFETVFLHNDSAKYLFRTMTYISTIMVLFGLFIMYLAGEIALAPSKRMKKGIKNMKYNDK